MVRALPVAAQGVLDLDVDLGAVEDRLALHPLVGQAAGLQGFDQRGLGLAPAVVGAAVLGRVLGVADAELDLVVGEAEVGQDADSEKSQDPQDLGLDLVGRAEDVGVVLGEAADPEQAVQRAAPLVAVDGAELGPAQGQVAVGAHPRLVDLDVERAVHRLHVVVLPVDIHRRSTCCLCRSRGGPRSGTGSRGRCAGCRGRRSRRPSAARASTAR